MLRNLSFLPQIILKETVHRKYQLLVSIIAISLATVIAVEKWPYQYQAQAIVSVNDEVADSESVSQEFLVNFAREAVQPNIKQNSKLPLFAYVDDVSNSSVQISAVDLNALRVKVISANAGNSVSTARDLGNQLSQAFFDAAYSNKASEYEFYKLQASDFRAQLQQAERNLKEFKQENLGYFENGDQQVNQKILLLTQQITDLQSESKAIQDRLIDVRNDLAPNSEFRNNLKLSPQPLSKEELLVQQQLDATESNLNTLRLTYLDTYPSVIQLKKEYEALQLELELVRNRGLENLDSHPEMVLKYEREQALRAQNGEVELTLLQLQKNLEAEVRRIKEISEADIQLKEITRNYQVKLTEYQSLLRSSEQSAIAVQQLQNRRNVDFSVVSSSEDNVKIIGVKNTYIYAAGLILVLTIVVTFCIAIPVFDNKIRLPDQIWPVGLPVMTNLSVHSQSSSIRALSVSFNALIYLMMLAVILWLMSSLWLSSGGQI